MAKIEVVKAVRIDGKVYSNPKFAALRWVKSRLRAALIRKACVYDPAEYDRAARRYRNSRLQKRYARMVEPYFARILS